MNTRLIYKYLITTLLGSTLLACSNLNAQRIYAGRYKAVFTTSPQGVPTSKVPDAPLAGNGDIGLTMGGNPDQLTFYFGKNDFWRAYPVYPGGGIAFPGGLNISIDDLKGASYYAEQIIDKAVIRAKFNKGNLEVFLNTWVSATKNNIVVEITGNKVCRLHFNLWAAQGNTSVNQSGKKNSVYWVTRSFENTPLLKWPSNIAMAMKIIGSRAEGNEIVLPAGKKNCHSG